jgi:LysM repeat protein
MVQAFSYCGVSNKVRVYEVYAVVNYRTKPTVKVNLPTGTVDSAAPVVDWTYSQPDGDPQKSAEYKIYTAAQQELPTFNPDTTPSLYPVQTTYTVKPGDTLWGIATQFLGDGSLWPEIYNISTLRSGDPNLIFPGEVVNIPGVAQIQGDITNFTLPFALPPNTYYIYVRVTSSYNARSDWANRAFTVTGSTPGTPVGGSFGGIGTGGGGGFDSVIADPQSSNAYVKLRDGSNMLSVQQADFETTTDSLGYTATNCALAQNTTTFYGTGSGSMSLTASSAADMAADSSFIEVAPSTPITARVQVLAATTGRSVELNVVFYDDTFTALGTGTITTTITDSTSTWTEAVCTGTTPSNTVLYAKLQVKVKSAANAEVHYIDHVGLMYGTNTSWSNGGHSSRNLLSSAASDADDPISTEPWTAAVASTYSRVATTGIGSEGAKSFKMLYAGLSPTISYVATSTAYTDTTTGTGFTLNKPASVADGDLLVAYVATDAQTTAQAPTGWTVVDSIQTGSGTTASNLTVMMRDGLAADPSTWVGNVGSTRTRCRTVVVAYRGAAAVASQFPQENVSGSVSGSLSPQTATVGNSDPGAWRLSAFAVRDDVSGGTMTANITPSASIPPIQYVGKAAAWSSTSNNTSFTINKPAGVASGDLLIASVAFSGTVTVTAPSGWTLVRTIHTGSGNEHSGESTLAILKYNYTGTATAWTGSHTSTGQPKLSQCVAYRNCDVVANQFIAEGGNTYTSSNMSTAQVTNTDSRAWRVTVFAPCTSYGASVNNYSSDTERCDDSTSLNGFPDVTVAMADSNGTVSTGHQQSYASSTDSVFSTASWIGILKPLSSAPSSGANETERQDATAGSGSLYLTLAVNDSNGVAGTGNQTVYGTFTPGSGTSVVSACTWLGFLVPSAATTGGTVGADLVTPIDITKVSSEVTNRAGNQVTVQAAFLGSTAGAPYLKLYSYVGNELVSTQTAVGQPFNTSTWVKSAAQFVLPPGTTRVSMGVSAADRQVNDYVLFDRVSLAFGADTVWRRGTGRTAHPIFNVPIVEYAEDKGTGYGDWQPLGSMSTQLLKYDQLTGISSFIDQTIVPLSARKYRAKTISYGLQGDTFVSDFGPESPEVTLSAHDWWLKDLSSPSNSMVIKVKADPLQVGTSDTSAVFQPLGADRPFVVTEGYKGDTIDLTLIMKRDEYAQLRQLFNSGRTLFLQSNMDNAWWVRPIGDISSATQLTGKRQTDPLRFVKVSFVEVAPEV